MSEREAPVDQAATSTPSSTRRPPSARLSGIDLPAQQLATGDRLAEQHAALREHGVHHRDGGWVIAQAPDVTAALTSPALTVAPADSQGDPPAGDARQLQDRMARFCDGPPHAHRRELVAQLLPDVSGLEPAAAQRTAADLRDTTGLLDVMPLARRVPVEVLAVALGVAPGGVQRRAAGPAVGDVAGRGVAPDDGAVPGGVLAADPAVPASDGRHPTAVPASAGRPSRCRGA